MKSFLYNYTWEENEASLCALEQRALFGRSAESNILESSVEIDPSRSPFIRERLDVICEGNGLEELVTKIKELDEVSTSFKLVYLNHPNLTTSEKVGFRERRRLEKEVGMNIKGEANLTHPDIMYGIVNMHGRWVFGNYVKNQAVWLHHQRKPHSYSTSLSTRVARAVANIAAPNPKGMKLIDPCCGIGTVVVEALSMGMDLVGSDRNPLIIQGVKENLAYFDLEGEVTLKDINDVTGHFDAAIIDMPYNLCSVVSAEEQLTMLQSAQAFAERVVIVTLEEIDSIVEKAGLKITDRCEVSKGRFIRQVLVCE
ncbi:TRM11 family SAM-dependent methyltransferase [Bacillus sp. 2205SS5-2]|uniref:TRM11 family SAM-dependent methyltransferase n=1 Tax=Bacillus sp. 2205SS5-2 TaxID=3109031 RepID=UPI0030049038